MRSSGTDLDLCMIWGCRAPAAVWFSACNFNPDMAPFPVSRCDAHRHWEAVKLSAYLSREEAEVMLLLRS